MVRGLWVKVSARGRIGPGSALHELRGETEPRVGIGARATGDAGNLVGSALLWLRRET
jgi:hypothetical protein